MIQLIISLQLIVLDWSSETSSLAFLNNLSPQFVDLIASEFPSFLIKRSMIWMYDWRNKPLIPLEPISADLKSTMSEVATT